jgi:hypothetical protein
MPASGARKTGGSSVIFASLMVKCLILVQLHLINGGQREKQIAAGQNLAKILGKKFSKFLGGLPAG